MEVVLLLIFAAIVTKLLVSANEKRRERFAEPVITASIATHSKTLYIKREQLKVVDPYGNVDYAKFWDHLAYFITHVIVRDLREKGLDARCLQNRKYFDKVYNRIILAVVSEAQKDAGLNLETVRTGIDYEYFCKHLLEVSGWDVLTTPATGDQGADLIGTKSGVRVVFQCKFYSQPVGNKAVQEAHTAKAFQRADYAVVVTNADFTAAARQLAQSSGVFLIHHNALSDLDKVLGGQLAQQNL